MNSIVPAKQTRNHQLCFLYLSNFSVHIHVCLKSLLSPHVHNLFRSHVNPDHLLLVAAAQVVFASNVPQDRIRPRQFHLKINSFQYVADMRQAL